MKKEEKKPFIQCYILGAIGGILMAAGDWLLGCVPLQKTDTGMFNRACYLSGAYALWKPALVVGMGALGCFLYSFMVKALNVDAGFSPGHMEHSAGRRPGYCPSDAGADSHMDVRNEPEQYQYRHRDLVHRGCGL